MGWEKNKTREVKDAKMIISWRCIKETLIRRNAIKDNKGHKINEVDNSENNITQKMSWNKTKTKEGIE